jgi:hypothetical protein
MFVAHAEVWSLSSNEVTRQIFDASIKDAAKYFKCKTYLSESDNGRQKVFMSSIKGSPVVFFPHHFRQMKEVCAIFKMLEPNFRQISYGDI